MFHILSISSTTLSALRCKQCLTIIFRQDSITDFISYDKEQFGVLEPFKNNPKLQTQAEYFVLQEQMSYYSTIKASYERSLIKNYHPFFKMHMLALTCAQCTLPIGYQVQTVNQNTLWLQNRLIIDVQSCALLKNGKDQMKKLIKILKTRLTRKLVQQKELNQESEQNEKKDIEKNKKLKQKEMIQKLQKIHDNEQQKNNKLKKKKRGPSIGGKSKKSNTTLYGDNNNKIFSPLQQKIPQSLATTNISSMNIITSKQDTYPIHYQSFVSPNLKFEDQEQRKHKIVEVKEEVSVERLSDGERGGSCDKVDKQMINKNNDEDDLIRLMVTVEQRQQMAHSLQSMRSSIVKQSQFIQSSKTVNRIVTALKKLSSQQKYINNKMPSQLLTLNFLLTLIRKRYIQNPHYK